MSTRTDTKTSGQAPRRRVREPRGNGATPKKRHREILDAAAEIFYRKGYADTAVQDVADAVGILKGSLYYYIDSKEDLLFQMLLEVHEDAHAIVEETTALDLPPLDRLRAYVKRHVEYNVRNLAKIAVYYHDFALLTPERRKQIDDERRFYEDFVKGLITEAQDAGEIDRSADPQLLANAIFGTINWIYTWYRPATSPPAQYLGDLYAGIVVGGVAAQCLPKPANQKTRRGKRS